METNVNSANVSQPLPQTNQIPNQPIIEPQSNKLGKIFLYIVGTVVFMAIGAFGYKLYESENFAQQSSNRNVNPTIKSTITTSPIVKNEEPTIEPTSTPKTQKSVITTPSAKFAPYFEKLSINLNDGNKLENYYTPSWFWCAFSNGERILDNSYNQYINLIGTTSQGKNVYILSNNSPFPKDQHLIPSSKKTMEYEGENGELITQEEWTIFLNNQEPDYPVIIIKDTSNQLIEYIRQDYLFLPGC